jgi:L-ascorbate metabolism protein UlaG (beta-lactamase superfamily)
MPPRAPITLTYLGVAGWQLEGEGHVVLVDPYFSRPDLDAPIAPDLAAITAHAPPRADLVLVAHSHVDHVLDAPALASLTGAELIGTASTMRFALAAGLARDRIVPVQGGEDYAFDGISVRVIPALHSALDDKHSLGGMISEAPSLPMSMDAFEEGGSLSYLVRIAGHEVFFLSSANFIEREVEGLRPDVAVIATGLRHEVYDYTCRLMRLLSYPPLVYTNHFDDWRGPPLDAPIDADLEAFIQEVASCSPGTRVVIPRHFDPMRIP